MAAVLFVALCRTVGNGGPEFRTCQHKTIRIFGWASARDLSKKESGSE
jgi:hypothetical protein